jgi:putative endonuclease
LAARFTSGLPTIWCGGFLSIGKGWLRGFTKKYSVHRLVYFEQFDDIEQAILREKRLKKRDRAWKVQLVEKNNPNWDDLYPRIARP